MKILSGCGFDTCFFIKYRKAWSVYIFLIKLSWLDYLYLNHLLKIAQFVCINKPQILLIRNSYWSFKFTNPIAIYILILKYLRFLTNALFHKRHKLITSWQLIECLAWYSKKLGWLICVRSVGWAPKWLLEGWVGIYRRYSRRLVPLRLLL